MKTCLILLTILFLTNAPALFGQSVYTDRDALGFSLSAGYLSSTTNVTGSAAGIDLSLFRKVDFSFALSVINGRPGYYDEHNIITGGMSFYPMKDWNDDPFTLRISASGSGSTLRGSGGLTVLLGTTILKELPISERVSFFPAASFMYSPYFNSSGDSSSFLGFDGSLAFKIIGKSKIVVNPAITTSLDSKITSLGIFGGIVL
jgi:hypothetical protein